MKVMKKAGSLFKREDAHGGSGGRKLLLSDGEMRNVQGMTHGYLPGGSMLAWHSHENMTEAMYVLKGKGTVRDDDGIYDYQPGDVFVFPAEIKHEIANPSKQEHEYIFLRIYQ
jgi:quercetin dioxygenase-like cupin family protein